MRRPVNYRLDPATIRVIDYWAKRLGISRTAIIELAIEQWALVQCRVAPAQEGGFLMPSFRVTLCQTVNYTKSRTIKAKTIEEAREKALDMEDGDWWHGAEKDAEEADVSVEQVEGKP